MKNPKKVFGIILKIAFGLALGFLLGMALSSLLDDMGPLAFPLMLLFLIIALFIHVVLHEAGHMIAGLISGYGFLSFRVCSFMLLKDETGFHFRLFSLPGTLGQCLLIPPEKKDEEIPYFFYNIGGILMNVILAAVSGLILAFSESGTYTSLFFAIMTFVGITMAIENALWFRSMPTDGANIRRIRTNPAARKAFYLGLRINAAETLGRDLSDLPEEWFLLPEKEEMGDMLVSSIPVSAEARAMEMGEWGKAEEITAFIKEDGVNLHPVYADLLAADMFVVKILRGEKAEADKKLRNAIKRVKAFPNAAVASYALAKFIDKDEKKMEKARKNLDKLLRTWPFEHDRKSQKRIFTTLEEMPLFTDQILSFE